MIEIKKIMHSNRKSVNDKYIIKYLSDKYIMIQKIFQKIEKHMMKNTNKHLMELRIRYEMSNCNNRANIFINFSKKKNIEIVIYF